MNFNGWRTQCVAPERMISRYLQNQNFRRAAAVLAITILFAGAIRVQSTPTTKANSEVFSYDASADLGLKEQSTKTADGVIIRDIDYASYQNRHGRIKAYIVKPDREGSFAGIVFFHWLGEKKSNRDEFLEEAIDLARAGTVSVLIQGFFPWSEKPVDGPTDRQKVIDQTIEVRRALDLLLAQPGVDAKRIGFVGHDYGAMFGAITAGLEHRTKAYVLMAGLGTFSDWSLKYWPNTAQKGEAAYREALDPLDPVRYVGQAAPATFLFQFSTRDKYIPRPQAESFFAAAVEPKVIKWYDVDHSLNIPAATKDRVDWLREQLGLSAAAH